MGTGQLMLSLAAMFLLSTLILRTNNNFLQTGDIMLTSKFQVLAVSLATSIIEEASNKAFDANTVDASATSTSDLTSYTSLGPMAGEVYPDFNDFDDFNGFVKVDSSMPSAIFKIECDVYYVRPSAPDVKLSQNSYHKRIDVTVTSVSMETAGVADSVQLSTIYSYWHFR
jgi:MSHA pilin protein MshD